MKITFLIIAIAVLALSFVVGLAGCATGDFRLKITPMKVEINPVHPLCNTPPPSPAPKVAPTK